MKISKQAFTQNRKFFTALISLQTHKKYLNKTNKISLQ